MRLNEFIENAKTGNLLETKLVFMEDFPTIASFLEGNPIAQDVVNAVMDLVYQGRHNEALAYLEKDHQSIKDQVMSLVYLQPHIAAKYDRTKNDIENQNND